MSQNNLFSHDSILPGKLSINRCSNLTYHDLFLAGLDVMKVELQTKSGKISLEKEKRNLNLNFVEHFHYVISRI